MKENPNSPTGTMSFSFEFPTPISYPALQNDVVFCGRVIIRQTEPSGPVKDPFMVRSNSFSKARPAQSMDRDQRWGSFQLPATRRSRLQRSTITWRYSNGLFGVVKCPVQMELSDMKKRQLAMLLKSATASDGKSEKGGGGKSGWKWQAIRSLRRKGRQWLNALSTSSFDF